MATPAADAVTASTPVPKRYPIRHHCVLKSCHRRVNNKGSLVTSTLKRKHSFLAKLCYDDDDIHYDSWHPSCQRIVMRDNTVVTQNIVMAVIVCGNTLFIVLMLIAVDHGVLHRSRKVHRMSRRKRRSSTLEQIHLCQQCQPVLLHLLRHHRHLPHHHRHRVLLTLMSSRSCTRH